MFLGRLLDGLRALVGLVWGVIPTRKEQGKDKGRGRVERDRGACRSRKDTNSSSRRRLKPYRGAFRRLLAQVGLGAWRVRRDLPQVPHKPNRSLQVRVKARANRYKPNVVHTRFNSTRPFRLPRARGRRACSIRQGRRVRVSRRRLGGVRAVVGTELEVVVVGMEEEEGLFQRIRCWDSLLSVLRVLVFRAS
jgi:hypothetical protein